MNIWEGLNRLDIVEQEVKAGDYKPPIASWPVTVITPHLTAKDRADAMCGLPRPLKRVFPPPAVSWNVATDNMVNAAISKAIDYTAMMKGAVPATTKRFTAMTSKPEEFDKLRLALDGIEEMVKGIGKHGNHKTSA